MAETENLKLALPGNNDYVDVEVLNENSKKLDAFAKDLNESKGAASGLATLGADGKIPSAQLPKMDYASSKHASQHASGGNDPISPESIGAAPGTYVEATLNVPARTEDPAAYLDNLLDEYIAKKKDKSVGFVCLTFATVHPILGGNKYIAKVNVILQDYVSIEAVSYANGSSRNVAKKFTRSKYNGVWGEWRNDDHLETGSYTGAGIHGESYKNSLTFGILPRFVLIFGPYSFAFYKWGDATLRVFIPGSGSGTYDNSATTDGKTMTWYTTTPGERDGSTQLNANEKYNYVAI